MKLSIKKENLDRALRVTERTTSKSASLPILGNVLLETEGNFLKLSSTNLEAGVHYWARADVKEEGQITVPAQVLSGFVGYLPSSSKVNMEIKKGVLHIECGETETKINGLSSDDFPIVPEVKDGEQVELPASVFAQALDQVAGTTSTSSIKPEISGVYLRIEKNMLTMTATDSFRLGERKVPLEKDLNLSKDYSMIVPREAADFLRNVLSNEEGSFKLHLSLNLIMVDVMESEKPRLRFVSKLIEGQYPNYKEIIPKDTSSQAKIVRGTFLNQLKQASLFASRINEVKIKLMPSESKVELSCQNPELGEYKSSFTADLSGEESEVSFNYRFLQDGLSTVRGNEIVLGLSGEGPAIIKPTDSEHYLYVVMPIQPA